MYFLRFEVISCGLNSLFGLIVVDLVCVVELVKFKYIKGFKFVY